MTIACCWLDNSLSRKRISAVADGRAADKENGVWKPLNDVTTKLFRVQVACYEQHSLDCSTGIWRDPYFTTELGLTFAGYCFEAQSIINFFMRAVSQLVAIDHGPQRPEPARLCEMLAQVANNWFDGDHTPNDKEVEFLLFGFSPVDGEPWVGKVVRPKAGIAALRQFEMPLNERSLFSIGDVGQAKKFTDAIDEIRKRVLYKANTVNSVGLEEIGLAADLEAARLQNADRMAVEDRIDAEIMDAGKTTVGGIMQKIEVFSTQESRGEVAFSRDDAPFKLDELGAVAPGLAYMGVAFQAGERGRPRQMPDFTG